MSVDRSAEEAAARQGVDGVRLPVAIGLLGVNAVWLLVSVLRLVLPTRLPPSYVRLDDFADRAAAQFLGFAGLLPIVLPLLAVLLVRHAGPLVRRSDGIAFLALGQYAVSLVFGLVTLVTALARGLTYTVSTADGRSFSTWRSAVEDGLVRSGFLVLLCLAALVVLRSIGLLRRARAGERPAGVPPGGFGQPYGSPPGFSPGGPRTAPRHGAGAQRYGEGRPAGQDLPEYVRRQGPVPEPSRPPRSGAGAGAGAGAGERTQVLSAEARDALERARIEASLRSGQHGPPPARHDPHVLQQQAQHAAPPLQQPPFQEQSPPWAALQPTGLPASEPPTSGPARSGLPTSGPPVGRSPTAGPPMPPPAPDEWPPEPQTAPRPDGTAWSQTAWPVEPDGVDDAERTRRLDGPRRGPGR